MQTVAVTGGSGRLGQAVLRELHTQGYQTRNLDVVDDGGLSDQFTRGDILDEEGLAEWLRGCDGLVHLAAIPAPGIVSADQLTLVNVVGTVRVLRQAAQAGIRQMVLASSASALGLAWGRRFMPQYLPIDEAHPLQPEEEYGVSKAAMEVYAAAFARHYALHVALLRFPTIVSDDMRQSLVSQFERDPEWAARLLWSYVELGDAARACRCGLHLEAIGAKAYYITAANHLAGSQLESLLNAYYPGVPRTEAFRWEASLISSAAAERELGWRPTVAWHA
jgi:nucleoside-diphosphate-sugar epimerase